MDKLYSVTLSKSKKTAATLSLDIGWLGFWVIMIIFFIKEIILEGRLFMIFFAVLMLLAGTLMNLAFNEIIKERRNKITELTEANVNKGYARAVTASLCSLVSVVSAMLFEAVIPYFYPLFEAKPYIFILLGAMILCSVLEFIGAYIIDKSIKLARVEPK